MPKKVKKVIDVFSTVVLVLIVLMTVLLVGARLIGLQVFTVLSGSMEPAYHTGSLIYVREVEDPHTLQTGDVITYMISEETVVTHRIAGIVPDDKDPNLWRFRTKGDSNAVEDATLVHQNNVIGSPVFTIPYVGYAANYVQNPPGTYIVMTIAALLLALMFLPSLFDEEEDGEEQPEQPEKQKKVKKQKQSEAEPVELVSVEVPAAVPADDLIPEVPAAAELAEEDEEDFESFLAQLWRDAGIEDDGAAPVEPAVLEPVVEEPEQVPVFTPVAPEEPVVVEEPVAEETASVEEDWFTAPVEDAAPEEEDWFAVPVVRERPKPLLYKPFLEDEVPEVREYDRFRTVTPTRPQPVAQKPEPVVVEESKPAFVEEPVFAETPDPVADTPVIVEEPAPVFEEPVKMEETVVEAPKPAPRRPSRVTIDTTAYAREDWRGILEALKAARDAEAANETQPVPQDDLEMDFADMFDWDRRRK